MIKNKCRPARSKELYSTWLFLVFLFCPIHFCLAQTPFQKIYGGASYDEGLALRQTTDQGFIIAGKTYSFGAGDYDGYVLKTDAEGTVLWSKSYGTTGLEIFTDVIELPDQGYLLAGSSSRIDFWMGTINMYYMVRINAAGEQVWSKQIATGSSRIHNIIPTADGNFALYGADAYQIYLGKINANGETLFYNTYYLYTGEGISQAGKGKQTPDGGFILCGQVRNQLTRLFDLFLLKVNAIGQVEWTKTYQAAEGSTYGNDVLVMDDGSFVVAGSADGLASDLLDAMLLKTDADGVLQWVRTYSGENEESLQALTRSCDGGFVLTGSSKSFRNNINDLLLIKTNVDGVHQWSDVHGSIHADAGNSITVTNDCGIAVTGATQSYGAGLSDVYLLKLNAEGEDLTVCNRFPATTLNEAHTLQEAWRSTYGALAATPTSNLNTSIANASVSTLADVCQACIKPVADFDYVQNRMSLHFLNYSQNGSRYTWTLENNVSDTMQNPVYEYTATGVYHVKLVVENNCGKDSLTKIIQVVSTTDCLFNLQPGPTRGQDASINNAPDKFRSNFSEQPKLIMNNWTHGGLWDAWRSVLRFDLSSVCDINHLLDARLSLYYPIGDVNYLHDYGNGFYISRISSPWKDYLVNWKNQPDISLTNRIAIGQTPWGSELLHQNVFQLTKDMIAEGNYGFMFQMQDETNRFYSAADYASSNFVLPEKRPLLQLRYVPVTAAVAFTDSTVCKGDSIQLSASGGVRYKWYPSDGLSCDDCPSPKASPAVDTEYRVFIYNCENCAEVKKVSIRIVQAFIEDSLLKLCAGDSVQLHASGSSAYHWSPDQWINDAQLQHPKVSPPLTTTYYVGSVNGTTRCRPSDSITVEVHDPVPPGKSDTTLCGDHLVLGTFYPYARYLWQDGSKNPFFTASDTGLYQVRITNYCGAVLQEYQVNKCCEAITIPNLITPNNDGMNDYFVIGCLGDGNWHLQVYNRWGMLVYENSDYTNNWNAAGLPDGVYYHTLSKKDRPTYKGWIQVVR